jgi:hypothetical protein
MTYLSLVISAIYLIENISFPVEKISKIPLIGDWTKLLVEIVAMVNSTRLTTGNRRMPLPRQPDRSRSNAPTRRKTIPSRLNNDLQTRNIRNRNLNTLDRRRPPVQILLEILDRRIPDERNAMTDKRLSQVNRSTDTSVESLLRLAIVATRDSRVGGKDAEFADKEGAREPVLGIGGDLTRGAEEEQNLTAATEGILFESGVGGPVLVGVGSDDVIPGVGSRVCWRMGVGCRRVRGEANQLLMDRGFHRLLCKAEFMETVEK